MKNNWITIGLIIGLTGFALYFWESAPKLLQPDPEAVQYAERFPYAMIEQAHSRHYNEQGLLSHEFVADKLRHFRRNLKQPSPGDYTVMDTLKVTLHTEQSPWFVTAEEGTLSKEGTVLTLKSNVKVWQLRSDGAITELTTSKLTLLPNNKVVTTEQPVTIRAPQGQLKAIGMTVDLNTQFIQLKSNVHGYHEPI